MKMKQIFRTNFTKRDKIINVGGLSGALVCFLIGWYIGMHHELTELTAAAWQEFNRWMMISDCFMAAGFILIAVVCIYNLVQNMKKEQ